MQIRKATMNDLPDILAIYAYAREYIERTSETLTSGRTTILR